MGRPRHGSIHRHRHHRHRNHLAGSLKRHLLITRRRIPPDRVDEYARLWAVVRARVGDAGARAWVFRAEEDADYFIEFVEWEGAETDMVVEQHAVAQALETMQIAFMSEDSQRWIEAKI